ncbi:iron-containing alcohol dehydrogenase [Aurantivibrio plasticivorans]
MTRFIQPMIHQNLPIEFVSQVDNPADAIARWLDGAGLSRALIVTNNSLSRGSGLGGDTLAVFQKELGERCVAVLPSVQAHTPYENVWSGVTLAKQSAADVLIAIGGGSVIDAAKIIQLALNTEVETVAELREYAQFSDGSRGPKAGSTLARARPIRFLAVPTTLSGAEFSHSASALNTDTGAKEGYRDAILCPQGVIYSPTVGESTPEWLWLSTAIRSLDHAIEGYCASNVYPYLEGQFLHAIRLFAEYLPTQKAAGTDFRDACSQLQQAVWLACSGLGRVRHGASHGIGYALGAQCGVPHGYTSCVMLPAVLEWNSSVNEGRQRAVAAALGGGDSAAVLVRSLVKTLGLPSALPDVGVAKNQLIAIAEASAEHKVVKANPRPIRSAGDVMEILSIAWEG